MALQKNGIILVPVDFTEVADFAVDHAVNMVRLAGGKIVLLHVITRDTEKTHRLADSVEQAVTDKLLAIEKRIKENYQVQTDHMTVAGSIFSAIGDTAQDIKASLVVMGIHGKMGIQHIVGSYAFKVILGTKTPVMVVKKVPFGEGYKNILIPLDFTKTIAKKVAMAIEIGKYFNSHIRLLTVMENSSSIQKLLIQTEVKQVKNAIEKAGLECSSYIIPKNDFPVYKNILDYAEKNDMDLVMIMTQQEKNFRDYFMGSNASEIIDKSDIPVITITPGSEIQEGLYFDLFDILRR